MIIRKTFKSIGDAEKHQAKLYNQYQKVRLIDFPRFIDAGTYAWEVSGKKKSK